MKRTATLAFLALLLLQGCASVMTSIPFATPHGVEEIAQAKKYYPGSKPPAGTWAFHGKVLYTTTTFGVLDFVLHVHDATYATPGQNILVTCPGKCETVAEGHLVAVLGHFSDGIHVPSTDHLQRAWDAAPFTAGAVHDMTGDMTYWSKSEDDRIEPWRRGRLFDSKGRAKL